MTAVDVSVIVPVRNGSNFLENCIGFLKAQTHDNFEILLVVDGNSTDDTVQVAERLSKTDERIQLIVQYEGHKLSGNRNLGLKQAVGENVWFVDVDDAPAPDFIKDLLRLQNENGTDFVCCNFINTCTNGVVVEKKNAKYHSKVMNRKEAMESRIRDEFPVSSWSKLFKRSFLIDNGLFFEESFAEDIAHTYRCLGKCNKICIHNRPLYAYRQTPNSICRTKSNADNRGRAEIESYTLADAICKDDPEALKRNALMKIRSSGHMSYSSFMEYAKSKENRASYDKYLKGTFEGWWNLHLSSTYWLAIRMYVALIYKRNGSSAMNKKFW